MKKTLLLLLLLTITYTLSAQKAIQGIVVENSEKKPLQNTSIILLDTDSILRHYTRTNEKGEFTLQNVHLNNYILLATYPKFLTYSKQLLLDQANINLDSIKLQSEAHLIDEIIVTRRIPIQIKGDTLEYDAASFETEQNAKLEDLLRRLPGLTVSASGEVTAQGKTVSKVLIDGEEFFGYDSKIAIRNIRADAIDKVQVYDRKSDESELTGIDDGIRLKTVNVVLKEEARKGGFGNANANIGSKNLFDFNMFSALFDKSQRVGITGNWNNMGSTGDASHIRSNSQITGKPEHKNIGTNYENNFLNKKLHLTASYNLNNNSTENESERYNKKVLTDNKSQETSSKANAIKNTTLHTFRTETRYKIDSLSNLIIRFNTDFGKNQSSSSSLNTTTREDATLANDFQSSNISHSDNNNFNLNTNYRRRLNTKGRSINININTQRSDQTSINRVDETTNLYNDLGKLDSSKTINQLRENTSVNNQFGSSININERLGKQINLTLGYHFNTSSRRGTVDAYNQSDNLNFNVIDTLYSKNELDNTTNNSLDLTLRYHTQKFNFSVSNRIRHRQQDLKDTYRDIHLARSFWQNNLNADAFYTISNSKSINLRYRNNTNVPNFNQLQRIQPPTNDLYHQIGNPNLKRENINAVDLNFNRFTLLKGSSLNINMSASLTDNAIINKTSTDDKGKTTATFVNLNDHTNWNTQINTNYGYPIFNGLVQFGPSASLSFDNNYQYVNAELNKNNTGRVNIGLHANKQNSKLIDFNFRVNMILNVEENSVQTQYNATSIGSSLMTDIKYFLPLKFNLTQVIYYGYTGKTKAFPKPINQFYMNLELSKKLLKNESLLLSIKGFDVFNSFNNINRSANGNNFSQTQQQLLTQYFMVGLKWDFNKNLGKKNE